jgi:hypothetical protein
MIGEPAGERGRDIRFVPSLRTDWDSGALLVVDLCERFARSASPSVISP